MVRVSVPAKLVERGDCRLAVTVEGEGPPLLYLHGLSAQGAIARREAPSGYRLATYDQRGHASATPFAFAEAYAIDELVADALAVLGALGWKRAALGGSSAGAAVALRLALDHPGLVETLILAGPAFGDQPNAVLAADSEIARDIETLGLEQAIHTRKAALLELGAPPAAAAFLDTWVDHDPRALATAFRTIGAWVPFRDLERVAELPMPIVVLGWPDDDMHPLALAERIAALANAPLATLSGVAEVLARPESVSRALDALLADAGCGPSSGARAS